MTANAPIDPFATWRTEMPICPHCMQKAFEPCDARSNSGETECGNCGESFSYERVIEVCFTTEKLYGPKSDKEEGKNGN